MQELTEAQRRALRWVVATVRAGQLGESFRLSWIRGMDGSERASLRGFRGDVAAIPPIAEGMFGVLVAEGYLAILINIGSTVTYTYTVRQAAYDAIDREAAGGAPPAHLDPPELRRVLVARLSDGEVRDVCYDLRYDSSNLPADTHAGRVRELLAWAERVDRLDELRRVVRHLRPDISGL